VQSLLSDCLLLAMLTATGLDLLNNPNAVEKPETLARDAFSVLGPVWALPARQRVVLWWLLCLCPALCTIMWHRQQVQLGRRLYAAHRDAETGVARHFALTRAQWWWTATFIGGYALRVWSKASLGRGFTYHVAPPLTLTQSGPYALLVHPSYTGGVVYLAAVLGVAGGRWQAVLAAFAIGIAVIASTRVPDEEAAIRSAFGAEFERHLGDRWRLLPFIY
jgi:protein-S-isoprenylcysteine O-methyltransferase Ste14